jgi:hypothetical protein
VNIDHSALEAMPQEMLARAYTEAVALVKQLLERYSEYLSRVQVLQVLSFI